jgi:hypothetical protein
VAVTDDGKGGAAKGDAGEPAASADGGATKQPSGSSGHVGDPDPPVTSGAVDDGGDDAKADAADGPHAADDGGAATVNPLESPKCKRTREAAKAAYGEREWAKLLGHLNVKACWKGKYRGDYADMKVFALFETGGLAECVKLEGAVRSAGAKTKVKQCQTRLAAKGG